MSKRNAQHKRNHDDSERVKVGDRVVIFPRGTRRTWTADFNYIDSQGIRRHGRRSLGTRNRRVAETQAWDLEEELAAVAA